MPFTLAAGPDKRQAMTQTNSLDPQDWTSLRALGHRMIDDIFDNLAGLREGPVWQEMPPAIRAGFAEGALPAGPSDEADIYARFQQTIAPYVTGNRHPRFLGWVHGGGNAAGMLGELLAAAHNANLGGRDHAGIAVERQVIRWSAQMLGLPATTGGLLVTGTSIANLIALICARTKKLGPASRIDGIGASGFVGYASAGVHRCVPGAFDMAGLGAVALRRIAVDAAYRIDITALEAQIQADRAAGLQPGFLVGTAGTVDVGAIDDLTALAALARREGIWFHVDAAFGALLALSPTRKSMLAGIEQADSVAFDFHKWAQVPYDCGCILVRDQKDQLAAFSQATNYLAAAPRGLAGGQPWPCDLGPDLSRGFRALKVWMTLMTHGSDKLGAVVDHTCALAQNLAQRVQASPKLELLAPAMLNIVCFRYNDSAGRLDELNADIVADLQESGEFAPSTTIINGQLAIRVAFVNHRTEMVDIDDLVAAVIGKGEKARLF